MTAVTSVKIWRWRRGVVHLAGRGEDVGHSFVRDLNGLGRSLQRDFADLASRRAHSAAQLGVDLVRLAAAAGAEAGFDWNRLSVSERRTLSKPLAKGEADG